MRTLRRSRVRSAQHVGSSSWLRSSTCVGAAKSQPRDRRLPRVRGDLYRDEMPKQPWLGIHANPARLRENRSFDRVRSGEVARLQTPDRGKPPYGSGICGNICDTKTFRVDAREASRKERPRIIDGRVIREVPDQYGMQFPRIFLRIFNASVVAVILNYDLGRIFQDLSIACEIRAGLQVRVCACNRGRHFRHSVAAIDESNTMLGLHSGNKRFITNPRRAQRHEPSRSPDRCH